MNNPLNNLLTRDEQRILGFLCTIMIIGMVFHYTGFALIFAQNAEADYDAIQQATIKDSLILIDIRTAGKEELMLLNGIGDKRANDIIAYRQTNQFDSPEELLNIKGIGAQTYLKMKPMLLQFGESGKGVENPEKLKSLKMAETSSGEHSSEKSKQELDETADVTNKEQSVRKSAATDDHTVIKLNSASRSDLISLDGIGEKKADAILAYREQIGKFTSVEQLLDVKGIGPKTLEKNRHRISL